jgi:DNA primase
MMVASYTPTQIKSVLDQIGVRVGGQTSNDFTCFCPFHSNRHSPAFNVSKTTGTYICFTPGCGVSGNLLDLIKKIGGKTEFQALRMLHSASSMTDEQFDREFESLINDDGSTDIPVFPQETLDRLKQQFWQLPEAHTYMKGRGFGDDVLEEFDIGYSVKQGLVTVPVHTIEGVPMGMVGRALEGKRFKNSPGLLKNKTIFNGHRAKRHGGTIILTEASFDVMSIHQAGYPMAGALLGGNLSKDQKYILNRYFTKIIIFTDFDDKTKHDGKNPGRDLGHAIMKALPHKEILWAYSGTEYVYHGNVKDATDLTPAQIRECIENSVSPLEYDLLDLY